MPSDLVSNASRRSTSEIGREPLIIDNLARVENLGFINLGGLFWGPNYGIARRTDHFVSGRLPWRGVAVAWCWFA